MYSCWVQLDSKLLIFHLVLIVHYAGLWSVTTFLKYGFGIFTFIWICIDQAIHLEKKVVGYLQAVKLAKVNLSSLKAFVDHYCTLSEKLVMIPDVYWRNILF